MAEEKPDVLWFNGRVVPWKEGTVHVWSELAIRGASVFEGLRAYWSPDAERHSIVALEAHVKRLYQSARIMRLPTEITPDALVVAIYELLGALRLREHAYIRPTLYIDSGRYGDATGDVVCGAYVVAFPVPRPRQTTLGARCCVSTWRRATDLTMPPRAKAGAAYQAFRLPIIEARQRGFDDTILLNERDKVAEASGAALFIVRGHEVITPPVTAGLLESITRALVIDLLRHDFDIVVREREVDRTELYVADEIFMCGTLAEIQPVVAVDDLDVGTGSPGPLTTRLRDRYIALCDSGPADGPVWMTAVPDWGDARRR